MVWVDLTLVDEKRSCCHTRSCFAVLTLHNLDEERNSRSQIEMQHRLPCRIIRENEVRPWRARNLEMFVVQARKRGDALYVFRKLPTDGGTVEDRLNGWVSCLEGELFRTLSSVDCWLPDMRRSEV